MWLRYTKVIRNDYHVDESREAKHLDFRALHFRRSVRHDNYLSLGRRRTGRVEISNRTKKRYGVGKEFQAVESMLPKPLHRFMCRARAHTVRRQQCPKMIGAVRLHCY